MKNLDKTEFLNIFEGDFERINDNLYIYYGIIINEIDFKNIDYYLLKNLKDLNHLLENNDEDEIAELHNSIMSYIFGDGENFQGSFESNKGDQIYNWFLDFGEINFNFDNKGFQYKNCRFYKEF